MAAPDEVYAIRPFRDNDASDLAALTLTAIRAIGAVRYSADQVNVWAARHPDAQRFVDRAANGAVILVAADLNDTPVAYALLEQSEDAEQSAEGHLDMLYCDPAHTRKGISDRLLAAAQAHAELAGMARLFTEASELAQPAFERAGYRVLHRRDFHIAGVAIHNYAMDKRLEQKRSC